MAVTVGPPDPGRVRTPSGNGRGDVDAVEASRICPYLISADGSWRSARPSREHRCAAIAPPPPLTPEKQRTLCLADTHEGCATFRAARTRALGPGGADQRSSLWPTPRTVPVLLETSRPRIAALPGVQSRIGGQIMLAVLLVVAFIAVVLARTSQPGPAPTIPPLPQVAAVEPTPSPLVTPTAGTPSPAPSGSVEPTLSATPSPTDSQNQETYKVKAGDTLIKIAAKHGVTVAALRQANGLANSSIIRIGQVLKIPSPAGDG
jgi:LysM repeat protein